MKKIIFLFFIFITNILLACPNCQGGKSAGGNNSFLILGSFIALSYIPMYLIFKMFKKYS